MTISPASPRIFVYGASGHGKVVADILRAQGVAVAGFIDDQPQDSAEILGLKVLGDGKWLAEQASQGPVAVTLGIGSNPDRQRIADQCAASGIQLLTAVHPSAVVAPSAQIGAGVVIMAAAVVNPDAHIGRGAILNTGVIVEHDCHVGEFAHLSPNAAMGGGAKIGSLSWLGMGASIIHGVAVGSKTIIGAGAVVVREIPDEVMAMGVPARVHRRLSERR